MNAAVLPSGIEVAVGDRPRDPRSGRPDPGARLPAGGRRAEAGRSSTTTVAAGCSARSTPTTAPAGASPTAPTRWWSRSTTGMGPEDRFPAAVDDAYAALQLGRAPTRPSSAPTRTRLVVAGDSAGGNLAAVVSPARTRRRWPGDPVPAARLPGHRPRVHVGVDGGERGGLLPHPRRDALVLRPLPQRSRPRATTRACRRLRAPDLSGLPPAFVITARVRPAPRPGHRVRRRAARRGQRRRDDDVRGPVPRVLLDVRPDRRRQGRVRRRDRRGRRRGRPEVLHGGHRPRRLRRRPQGPRRRARLPRARRAPLRRELLAAPELGGRHAPRGGVRRSASTSTSRSRSTRGCCSASRTR